MSAPIFLSLDGAAIRAEIIAEYEALTGKTLYPAQAEMFLINAFAYRELLLRQQFQAMYEQQFVDFSTAPQLDYLGQLLGVSRLAASAASTTIEFTLVAGHAGVVVPEGTRIASVDGRISFATVSNLDVDAGVLTAEIEAYATLTGSIGNGYAAGQISDLLDTQPYLISASNTATTSGGADEETDTNFRVRIKAAPAQFSTAGPTDAYRYYALSASPAIVDVAVTSPTPGEVNVFPLMADGSTTSPSIITLVELALNDERVRPLTDTVVVLSPTMVHYDLEVELTAYTEADTVKIIADVTAALVSLRKSKSAGLGQDIVISQIVARCMVTGTYDVDVISPASDITIDPTEVAICDSITVTVTGTTNG